MRAGFVAGVAFVLGVVAGTLFVAPLLGGRGPDAHAVARPAAPAGDPFDRLSAEGNAAMDGGRWQEAVSAYERALAIRFDGDIATDRGICLRQLGRREEALAAFEFVTLKDPSHWQARYNLTAMLIESGHLDDARTSLAILERQRPDDEAVMRLKKALPE